MVQTSLVRSDVASQEIEEEVLTAAVRRKCNSRTAPICAFKPILVAKDKDFRQSEGADAVVPRWRAKDPNTGEWEDYDEALSVGLEQKFQKGRHWVKFLNQGAEFEVDLTPGAMLEYVAGDSSCAPREVQRAVPHGYTCESSPLGCCDLRQIQPKIAAGTSPLPFPCGASQEVESWKVGQEVEVLRSSGSWEPATIADMDDVGAVTVSFSGGEKVIPPGLCHKNLRPRRPETKERRIDSMLGGRAVSFSEMCRGLSGQGLTHNQLQSHWSKLPVAGELPPGSVSAMSPESRPMLFVNEKGAGSWKHYTPNMRSVLVIGPGAGVHQNARAYQGLREAGWEVTIATSPGYDKSDVHPDGYLYPPGWEHGQPELDFNEGKNLASLADNVVAPLLEKLVAAGKGPAAVIAGSRGGQVTLPRLWNFWRGPTLVINGGCVKVAEVPPAPVRLVLLTCGLDFFDTKDPHKTAKQLHKEDASCPVLMYHDPREGHMPRHFCDVVEPLVDVAVSEESFQAAATAAVAGPCILSKPKAKRHGVVLKVL